MCCGLIDRLLIDFGLRMSMGSHALEILRQGLWASLTGGWFYDPHQGIFCNTFHLYLWLFLLCFPLTLYLTLPSSLVVWTVYSCVLGGVFITVKIINYRLHHMFDTSEVFEEESSEGEKSDKNDSSSPTEESTKKTDTQGETSEGIELAVISTSSRRPSSTPPVQCSSRNSMADSSREGAPRKGPTPADSMEYINKLVEDHQRRSSALDLKVDVHRRDSLSELEGAVGGVESNDGRGDSAPCTARSDSTDPPMPGSLDILVVEGPKPRILSTVITPNATPGAERKQSLTEEGEGPRKRSKEALNQMPPDPTDTFSADAEKADSTDRHFSPGHRIKSRRARRAVRRTRSALDARPRRSSAQAGDRASTGGRDGRAGGRGVSDIPSTALRTSRPRQLSLSEGANEASDTELTTSKFNPDVKFARLSHTSAHEMALGGELEQSDSIPRSEILQKNKDANDGACKKCSDAEVPDVEVRHARTKRERGRSTEKKHKRRTSRDSASCKKCVDKSILNAPTVSDSSSPVFEIVNEKTGSCDPSPIKLSRQSSRSISPSSYHTPESSRKSSMSESDCDTVIRRPSAIDEPRPRHRKTRRPDMVTSTDEKSDSSQTLTEQTNGTNSGSDKSDSTVTSKHKKKDNSIFKLPGFLQGNSEDPPSPPQSQQSSVVGLDWLFSTDSESATSESHSRSDSMDSSSTLTNEEDIIFEGINAERLAQLRLLGAGQGPPPGGTALTSPEDQQQDLETQRAQGAIPKRRPPPKSPSTGTEESCDDVSLSPHDREKVHRLVLEILKSGDPLECEEELEKLKEELSARRSQDVEGRDEKDQDGTRPKTRTRRRDEDPSTNQEPASSSRESSASNPSESSALLPTPRREAPGAEGGERSSDRRRRRRHSSRSSKRSSIRSTGSPPRNALENIVAGTKDRHLASSHDDTTEGAVHCFQDEFGNWLSYTFGENSAGVALGVIETAPVDTKTQEEDMKWDSSTESGSTVILESPRPVPRNSDPIVLDLELPGAVGRSQRSPLQSYVEALLESGGRHPTAGSDTSSDTDTNTTHNITNMEEKPKHYYKLWLVPFKFFKIRFDRLALLALLDRNLTLLENLVSILLGVGVGILGALLLSQGFFQDFWIFLFCLVMASCQYSLLKSVQPDAASPMHGYNRIIAFSRPFYFCVCASLILVLHYASQRWSHTAFHLYGMHVTTRTALVFARDLIFVFMLCFPLLFTMGLLPQVNTFVMYILEQIEIHIFGGNATTSLGSSVFTVFRSCLAVAFLYGFAFAGLKEKDTSQHVLFSIYSGILVSVCYHLSRCATDPSVLWAIVKKALIPKDEDQNEDEQEELVDPLPEKLRGAVCDRLRSDGIVCCFAAVLVFAVHVSTAFSSPVLQPTLFDVLVYLAVALGVTVHYFIPQLRKEMPWLCCSHPILPSRERSQFEVRDAAKVMWFDKMYVWLRFFERNFMYPAVCLCALTSSAKIIIEQNKFGLFFGTLVVVVSSIKLFRSAFSDTPRQHLVVLFTMLFFKYDYRHASETFLIDYFFMSILFIKFYDLLLKVRFIITYIAPWQITWGSAFHAFAQPFSVPHSAMLFVQAGVSAFLSTPLNPLLGSAIFITSYVRPVKFWERDYNTKRVDHSNTRLSSQLERNPGADDNNLNSIFYEHLTRSLQHSLCGDLLLGRWGNVGQGDCFIMASDYLNALVHIIEMGNGLVTFQLRGLEFRGTYCQQREVEAITEGVEEDEGFCCCEPGHLPHFLSLNAAFNQRWLAWEVVVTKYVLEGYSISDNSAASMLQVFDLRKVLITYYVKSIIYYTVRSPKLEQWLAEETIQEALRPTLDKNYVDLDPVFNMHVDEDFDSRPAGVTKNSFCNCYLEWIQYCASRREQSVDSGRESWLVSLCYGLSLLGRRALGAASHNNSSASVDFFLFGLHALFKGDFRITCTRDEWVFTDMELLRRVVAPGVRMSLKLHQDHFTSPDEYEEHPVLYNAITSHEQNMVISHEADPAWRNAVLANTSSLLALRHVFDEGSDEYKIIMLNKRFLSFRVIKVNRECVRGLWAGQQQELVFLRNRNPERGSIQNAKQALRNMINSSCDQPIGYPIYVSPLTTSYSGTNNQYNSIVGKEFSLNGVIQALRHMWRRMRLRCGASCTSGSSAMGDDPNSIQGCPPGSGITAISQQVGAANPPGANIPLNLSQDGSHQMLANRGSMVSMASCASKPSSAFVSIAGLIGDNTSVKEPVTQRVQITDPSCVYDTINLGRRIDVQWPNDEWRLHGGKNHWAGWVPEKGMEGNVVHRWMPCHREPGKRSHVDKTILLVQIGERYVPIAEAGVTDLGAEV